MRFTGSQLHQSEEIFCLIDPNNDLGIIRNTAKKAQYEHKHTFVIVGRVLIGVMSLGLSEIVIRSMESYRAKHLISGDPKVHAWRHCSYIVFGDPVDDI